MSNYTEKLMTKNKGIQTFLTLRDFETFPQNYNIMSIEDYIQKFYSSEHNFINIKNNPKCKNISNNESSSSLIKKKSNKRNNKKNEAYDFNKLEYLQNHPESDINEVDNNSFLQEWNNLDKNVKRNHCLIFENENKMNNK